MALTILTPTKTQEHRNADQTGLRGVILETIRNHANNSERSLQKRIGPSQVGTPCHRRLAFEMSGLPETRDLNDPLASILGTAFHTWLAECFAKANPAWPAPPIWLLENKVDVGFGLRGSSDVFHIPTGTVLDWKGLYIHTAVPTPGGWTTMDALVEGDEVFGLDGTVCRVTKTYPVTPGRDCYRVTFDDGTSVVTDDVQQWNVVKGGSQRQYAHATLSTAEMAGQLFSPGARPQRHLRVFNAGPLQAADVDLPVHPYVLGAWLGDGGKHGGTIGCADPEIYDKISSCGYELGEPIGKAAFVRTVRGLSTQLQVAGLQWKDPAWPNAHGRLTGVKMIPEQYLRASHGQRLELLRGLMDTDGTWNRARHRAEFSSASKALSWQVSELVNSLGWKASVIVAHREGFGVETVEHGVHFTPFDDNPFHLPRKADQVRIEGSSRARYRVVRSVEKVPSVPTKCIDVDSDSHLYLAGEAMVPVHNCLGNTTFDKYTKVSDKNPTGDPSEEYRVQAHSYGLGFARLGFTVNRVAIMMFGRSKFLRDAHIWSEPWQPDIALKALHRMTLLQEHLARGNHPVTIAAVPGGACHFCKHKSADGGKDGYCAEGK